ncbi:Hypothetical protein CINCED_3A025555 [Cinara cedri]|uniref:Uncharacterized protein n=1 Tax=Cinara cedri TaxID=506608 RepID=A0A5E4M3W6_9HEMI|nr:Hypothetical protein CINCED_3A025555 [Cinara cedri]
MKPLTSAPGTRNDDGSSARSDSETPIANCIFHNRHSNSTEHSSTTSFADRNTAGSTTVDGGGRMRARPSRSDETTVKQRHRTFVLEALFRLWLAAQKYGCLARNDTRIPADARKYFADRFADTKHRVDGFVEHMYRLRQSGGGRNSYTDLYAGVFQLEARFNADIQRYKDLLITTGPGGGPRCGLYMCLMNLMRFLCGSDCGNNEKK